MTSVRLARPTDAEAVARIYNAGVEERQATLERRPLSAADFAERIERSRKLPIVVAEQDGPVVGWAAVGEYNPRECYRGVGEATLYVEPAARGRGIGRRLLEALAAEAERAGY